MGQFDQAVDMPARIQAGGRATYTSAPAGLWSMSGLLAAAAGVGALVIMAILTVLAALPIWAPLAAAVVLAGLTFAAAGPVLVFDERRVIHRLVGLQKATSPAKAKPPRIVWAYGFRSSSSRVLPEPEADDVSPPEDAKSARYAFILRYFLRISYSTGDPTWQTWSKLVLPDGTKLSRDEWEWCCDVMIRAHVATRSYPRAPIRYTRPMEEIKASLREVLALAPPAGGEAA